MGSARDTRDSRDKDGVDGTASEQPQSSGLSQLLGWTSAVRGLGGLRAHRQRAASMLEPTFTTNPHNIVSDRVVIAMVGLPARGKSYISQALVRYLNFLGCPARIFNAGNKRREEGAAGVQASFFDASNLDAKAQRERMAMETLEEVLEWLQSETRPDAGCACGVFDATNTTKDRRERVRQRVAREQPPVRLIFLESICDDVAVLENNYRMKLSNDDYKGIDPEAAIHDFKQRVVKYEAVYERVDDDIECRPLDDVAPSAEDEDAAAASGNGGGAPKPPKLYFGRPPAPGCVKLIDAGRKLVVTNAEGSYVISELLSLLHSFSLAPRCIWITVVGETSNDLRGMLGGDSQLSRDGLEYARAVRDHVLLREQSDELKVGDAPPEPAMILTGTLRRYAQMAEALSTPVTDAQASVDNAARKRRIVMQLRGMNELCAGKLDSLSYEQMRENHPREYAARAADKLHYRYPGAGGESYMDLIMRLDSIITMLEQVRGNAIVVCDRAVCRVLLGYFDRSLLGETTGLESLPNMELRSGVIELRRSHSGFSSTHTEIDRGQISRIAGPGTNLSGQTANRLPASTGWLAHASSAPSDIAGFGVPRVNTSP